MKKETITELSVAAGGAGAGAALGTGIGIAGIFGAAPATIPLALIVGGVGWGYAKIRNLRKENARLKALVRREISETL